jgi:hypothetical protein
MTAKTENSEKMQEIEYAERDKTIRRKKSEQKETRE